MIKCDYIIGGIKKGEKQWTPLSEIIEEYYNKYEVIDIKFAGKLMDGAYIIYVGDDSG